ncbi:metalloendopeptidase [Oleoguttula sp. CCFEE 5521]
MTTDQSRTRTLPPTRPALFGASAESLLADTNRLLERAREVQNGVVTTVTRQTATFANTLLPLIREENARLYERQQIEFYAAVSADATIREASLKASSLFGDFDTDTATRQDVYDLLIAVRANGELLDPESQAWLMKSLSSSERNGLSLSADGHARLKAFNADLAKLEREYIDRCDDTAEANVPLLRQITALRLDKAKLLRHASYGSLRMAGLIDTDPMKIQRFFEDTVNSLQPVRDIVLSTYRQIKRSDLKSRHEEDNDPKFYSWDRHYYSEKLLSRDYALDGMTISEYFALEETVTRMLGIFEHVMSLSFQESGESDRDRSASDGNGDAFIWQNGVQVFAVWDTSSSSGSVGTFLGWLYMDMYPREGKRSGFSDQPVRPVSALSVL